MLQIKPVSQERLQELIRQNGAPASMFCCEADDNGTSQGFIMFNDEEGTLKVSALCCAADLADDLLQAGFRAGFSAGMKNFAFTTQVVELWRNTLRALGYAPDGGELEAALAKR